MAGGGGSVVLEIDTILCLVCVLYVLFFWCCGILQLIRTDRAFYKSQPDKLASCFLRT